MIRLPAGDLLYGGDGTDARLTHIQTPDPQARVSGDPAVARFERKQPLYTRSLAVREKVLGPDHPDVATSLNNLGLLYDHQGRYADAEPLFKRSLAIYEKGAEYRSDNVPETIMVVNPAHRVLASNVRKKVGVLNRRIAEFGAINLDREIEPPEVEAYAQNKSDLQEVIMRLKKEVDELKAQRKATQRHI